MKAFVVFAVFVWFLCGFVGAWMMGDMHFKTIARGADLPGQCLRQRGALFDRPLASAELLSANQQGETCENQRAAGKAADGVGERAGAARGG